jgi:hypothetical protein
LCLLQISLVHVHTHLTVNRCSKSCSVLFDLWVPPSLSCFLQVCSLAAMICHFFRTEAGRPSPSQPGSHMRLLVLCGTVRAPVERGYRTALSHSPPPAVRKWAYSLTSLASGSSRRVAGEEGSCGAQHQSIRRGGELWRPAPEHQEQVM